MQHQFIQMDYKRQSGQIFYKKPALVIHRMLLTVERVVGEYSTGIKQ